MGTARRPKREPRPQRSVMAVLDAPAGRSAVVRIQSGICLSGGPSGVGGFREIHCIPKNVSYTELGIMVSVPPLRPPLEPSSRVR